MYHSAEHLLAFSMTQKEVSILFVVFYTPYFSCLFQNPSSFRESIISAIICHQRRGANESVSHCGNNDHGVMGRLHDEIKFRSQGRCLSNKGCRQGL